MSRASSFRHRTLRAPACFFLGFDSHPLWNDDEMGTDMTSPKGDKSASEGNAAVAGATRAAVRKLGQELGIPAAQLPLEDFSFLTKVRWGVGWCGVCMLLVCWLSWFLFGVVLCVVCCGCGSCVFPWLNG